MEGGFPQVKGRGSGRLTTLGRTTFILLSLFPVTTAAQTSRRSANFIVVERTSSLVIYDGTQRRLAPQDPDYPPPFAPFKIISTNATLSDNFTPCMAVTFDGKKYFLLNDEKHTLIRSGPGGYRRLFQAATEYRDTMQVAGDRMSELLSPAGASGVHLPKGTLFRRWFSADGRLFVRTLADGQFGWIDSSDAGVARLFTANRSRAPRLESGTTSVLQNLQTIVDDANLLLSRLYALLNQETHLNRPIPQWRITTNHLGWTCRLEPASIADGFAESTRLLAAELRHVLADVPLTTREEPGVIELLRAETHPSNH
jgi:hypothetical protein